MSFWSKSGPEWCFKTLYANKQTKNKKLRRKKNKHELGWLWNYLKETKQVGKVWLFSEAWQEPTR